MGTFKRLQADSAAELDALLPSLLDWQVFAGRIVSCIMPLRAIINNEDVLAPFLDDEAWQLLKTQIKNEHLDVRLPCCGSIAYLRTSKHGLNHFVHKERDTCTSAPETWQHLKVNMRLSLRVRLPDLMRLLRYLVMDGVRTYSR